MHYDIEIPEYRTTWHIREDKYHELVLTNLLEFHIISLEKFEKIKSNENKSLASWLRFIKNPNLMEANDMENPEIKKAKKEYDKIAVDKHERYLAEQRLIRIMDEKAIRRGGFNDGKVEGQKEKQIEIAKNLLKEKSDIELIIKVTRTHKRRNRKFIIKNISYCK